MTYSGIALADLVGKHPAFKRGHGSHNTLYSEMEAAAVFGMDVDTYFNQPRRSRLIMTAFAWGRNALAAMQAHDTAEEIKNKKPPK